MSQQKLCPYCGYGREGDTATPEEHRSNCASVHGGRDYTADPACAARDWHHVNQWCDTCKGVA